MRVDLDDLFDERLYTKLVNAFGEMSWKEYQSRYSFWSKEDKKLIFDFVGQVESLGLEDLLVSIRAFHENSARVNISVGLQFPSYKLFKKLEDAHESAGSSNHRYKESYRVA